MQRFRFHSKSLISLIAATILSCVACDYTVGPTSVSVKDPVRHYYPIVQKDELRMSYEITNTGDEPLVITDVVPSCSAIVFESGKPDVIPPGETEIMNFIFHSEMNIGYASHDIRLYGNILPEGEYKMTFDVHIVRPTLDRSDFEEILFDSQSARKTIVDGKLGEKGYWTDGQLPKSSILD